MRVKHSVQYWSKNVAALFLQQVSIKYPTCCIEQPIAIRVQQWSTCWMAYFNSQQGARHFWLFNISMWSTYIECGGTGLLLIILLIDYNWL